MLEIWKDIPDFNGKYQASTSGNIRRVYAASGRTKLLSPYKKLSSKRKHYVVNLTKDGEKAKQVSVAQLIARTFLGECPPGMVPVHRDRCQSNNSLTNIAYMSRRELGKVYGGRSSSVAVAKIDQNGEIVDVYPSARAAGRKNFMSYQTIIDRCNGKCKSPFAPDGYAYAWDDSEVSMRRAIRKIELANVHMPKARCVDFDF